MIATLLAAVAAGLFIAGILPMRFSRYQMGVPDSIEYPLVPYWGGRLPVLMHKSSLLAAEEEHFPGSSLHPPV